MLENLSGNFRIDKVSLTLDTAGGALMHPAPGQTLSLGAISAVIPNMELNSVLQVTGNSSGSVPAYLALVANSPLGKLLDGALDEAQGTGDWRMPIKLTVPLLNTDDTQVDGHIQFADNSFSFMPEMPLLTQMHGDLEFSEKGVQTREVRAQFLGGPVKISGRLAQSGDALNFEGTLAGAGLTQISNAASMSRFGQGRIQGQAQLPEGRRRRDLGRVRSGGDGDRHAGAGWQVRAVLAVVEAAMGPAQDQGSRGRRWLTASLGTTVNALFERDPASRSASYFARGAVGINRPASLPTEAALSLSASLPELDMDGWEKVGDGFSVQPGKGKPAPADPAAARPCQPGHGRVAHQRLHAQ